MDDNTKKFETRVKYLKYEVLKNVARAAFEGNLAEKAIDIPKQIIPGKKPTMRCCVYKERAILSERVKLAMGGDKTNPNVIEVISIACDECKRAGFQVTDNCRGCIAHHCESACAKGAISFDEHMKAHINTDICVQCGSCAGVCPYGAIIDYKRPCEKVCKTNAISMGPDGEATINNDDCIACGACVNSCPFGAVMDKSYILQTIELLKAVENDKEMRLFACVAPAIAVQYKGITVDQVVSGLLELGFTDVVEAAFGADIVASRESLELSGKGTLTSSCCPAFVALIKKKFPDLAGLISDTPSPMVMAAMAVKAKYPNAKVVFIGPCTAKKAEQQLDSVSPFIDNVVSFEEMDALFGAKNIDLSKFEPDKKISDATSYGRNFAQSGGVAASVTRALHEHCEDFDNGFDIKTVVCNGADECIKVLKLAQHGKIDGNFIEGMACVGGCVNGAVSLRHLGQSAKFILEKHSGEVKGKRILENTEYKE